MASRTITLAVLVLVAGLMVGAGAARIAARPVADTASIDLKGVEAVAHGYQARISIGDETSPPSHLILSSSDGVVCQTAEMPTPSSDMTAFFPARDCSEPLRSGSTVRLTGRLDARPFSLAATMH